MNKRRILALLLLVAGLLAVGAWLADRKIKSLRHPGLTKFIGQWFTNYPASFRVEPMALHIRIEQRDMDRLQHMVEEARERGVILPEGREYVPAVVEGPDGEFKARIRIKGKMTDHVKGSKWSFRVQARKDGGFQGMQRFSLQHPGTRNYLTDWFFHRLMADEGSIALRYGFIRLHFNGEDLGIYAYEEHFGPELLAHNGRVEGPLFRFDPSLFWEHRLNEMRKLRFDEPFAAYQAASVDAFGTGDLAKDTVARSLFEEAVSLIEGFRRGRLRAAQVFDADRLGLRHAVLDLVGGHHSLDWSDVKFYYDPILQRVEPVAYESFSAFRIRSLSGSHRYVGHTTPAMDLHDAYFNDPDVFRAYVRHLERVSRKSYLDSVFAAVGPALDSASAIVYQEFPYKELDHSIYYHNQRVIRKLLDVPKGFHAHDHGLHRDTLTVMAVPIEGLPIEVHGLLAVDGSLLPLVGEVIIPVRQQGHPGQPLALRFHVPDSTLLPRLKDRRIAYSVLGGKVRKELEVFTHRLYEDMELAPQRLERSVDMRSWPFVEVDEATRTVYLRPGSWMLDGDLVIPEGYQVKGTAPLRIDLVKGARVISRSPIELMGYEDAQVVLASSDSSGGGVLVYGTSGPSKWEHVRSEGFGPAERGRASLVFQDAPLVLRQCTLAEHRSRDLLHVVRSQARILGSLLVGGRDQVVVAHAPLRISNSSLLGAGDDGLVVHGGVVRASGTTIQGAVGIALKVDAGGELEGEELHLRSSGRAVLCAKGSRVVLRNGSLTTPGIGVDVKDSSPRHGASNVILEAMTIEAGKEAIRPGEGNQVQMDGREIQIIEGNPAP